MGKNKPFIHPYIPNSDPEIKDHMLKEIGVKDVEEIYKEIPDQGVKSPISSCLLFSLSPPACF